MPNPDDGFKDLKVNLPKLSLPEKVVVAKVRMCMALLKYTVDQCGNEILGHGNAEQRDRVTVLQGQCVGFENRDIEVETVENRDIEVEVETGGLAETKYEVI